MELGVLVVLGVDEEVGGRDDNKGGYQEGVVLVGVTWVKYFGLAYLKTVYQVV